MTSNKSVKQRSPRGKAGPLYPRTPKIGAEAGLPAEHARRFADMVIRRMQYLRGPSVWTYRPVIEAVVDIGELEDFPSNTLPGFYERLAAWLPGLVEHRCGVGQRGGFLMRLRDGTWPGHIMEHVALELQTQAGMPTGFGKARETHERGVYKVVIRTHDEVTGRLALSTARDLVMAAINNQPFDVAAAIARLAEMVDGRCLGHGTACIVDAAGERGIPAIRLNEGNLVQLGHGSAMRRIWVAQTDCTSAIAEGISRDWDLTGQLLVDAGLPVPESRAAADAEQAWEAAEDIGLPVVVKPADGPGDQGVLLALSTRQQVQEAFAVAARKGDEVLIERHIPGVGYRLLVVGGRVVAATRGTATAAGQGTDDVGADVTECLHPDTAAVAVLAARVVGLDIAGIDLIVRDIAQPLTAQDGAIVKVSADPDLLMHLRSAAGRAQPVGAAIVDHLFPAGSHGRVPIVGLLSDGQSALAARLMAWLLQLKGLQTALACREGSYLGARQLSADDARHYQAGEQLLINRNVQAAVIETTPAQILSEGLPYDRCQLGVVMTMPGPEGLQEHYITEAKQMPGIARTQIDVVLPQGASVLNADDPEVLALAEYSDGEVLLYSVQAEHPAVQVHLARKGRAVFARQGRIVLATHAQETLLLDLRPSDLDGFRRNGPADPMPHLLAAVAVAWVMDMPLDLMRAGLLRFGKSRNANAVH